MSLQVLTRFIPAVLVLMLVAACGNEPPPTDAQGQSPDDVLLATYLKILGGDLAAAKQAFDPRLLKAVLPPTNPDTFESFYQKQTADWQPGLLRTKIVGNDYSAQVWRVRIWSDDGSGSAGAVQDLALIDGEWKIVFWGDYPKR